jgi:hypothetical protein
MGCTSLITIKFVSLITKMYCFRYYPQKQGIEQGEGPKAALSSGEAVVAGEGGGEGRSS